MFRFDFNKISLHLDVSVSIELIGSDFIFKRFSNCKNFLFLIHISREAGQ
jgi:hypothetical protein